jgi:hypothetical protein
MRAFVRVVCAVILSTVVLLPGTSDPVDACGRPLLPDDEASHDRVRAVLDALWGAGLAERRSALDESWLELELVGRLLGDPDHEMYPYLDETVRGLLDVEDDDFTLARLLDAFGHLNHDWARGIFREALRHDSPYVRRRAVKWFALRPDPDPEIRVDLERLWRVEDSAVVRANLIGALACQGSQRHAEDLLRIARSDDLGFAPIAVRALAAIDDWRVLPLLTTLLRGDTGELRIAALEALAAMPDSPEAQETVIEVVRRGPSELRGVAIRGISAWPPARGTPLLLEVLSSKAPAQDRSAALEQLWYRDDPRVSPALERIAAEAMPATEQRSFHDRAATLLEYRRNENVLESIDAARAEIGGRCRFATWNLDPDDDGSFRVVAEPGLTTMRCWSSPGVDAVPTDSWPRIGDGQIVQAVELYEGREPWMAVSGTVYPCWVPRDALEPAADGDDDEAGRHGEGPLGVEIDIAPWILETDEIAGLLDAGVASVIDPSADVVGLALSVDLMDAGLLRELLGLEDRFGWAFDDMLYDIASVADEHAGDDPGVRRSLDAYFDREQSADIRF